MYKPAIAVSDSHILQPIQIDRYGLHNLHSQDFGQGNSHWRETYFFCSLKPRHFVGLAYGGLAGPRRRKPANLTP